MKILLVTEVSDRSEKELFKGLADRGHALTLICSEDDHETGDLSKAGIEVVQLEIKHRLDFSAVKKIRNIIKKNSPDIIYATNNKALSTSLFASLGLRVDCFGYRGTHGHLNRFDPSSWLTHLNPRLKGIICNCTSVKNYLASLGIPQEKLFAVYKGHSADWYQVPEADRSQFHVPEDVFLIGCIANVRPVKGINYLLEALADLGSEINYRCLVVGDVRDREILELCTKLNLDQKVEFCGFRSDATSIIKACDITVMPSIAREGIPRAVVESMFCGVPVIVSDVGGLPEIVRDGITGYVVPPKDSNTLKHAILDAYNSRSKLPALSNAAETFVKENLNMENYLTDTENVFRGC